MRNTPALKPGDLEVLKKLQDAPLAQYLLQIALASEKISELKTHRAANIIQRAWLLALIHKTLMGTVAQRRQLEAEWANTKTGIEANIQAALKTANYAQLGSLAERLRVTQEYHNAELAKLEGGLTPEGKIAKLTRLTERTTSLTHSLAQQNQQLIIDTSALTRIPQDLLTYLQSELVALEKKAQSKPSILKTLPSIYVPQPKTVDEKAQAVAKELSAEAIQAYLTGVYRGELDTVERLLKDNPSLVHAQGDLTDLSKRTFTNITGFQYAVWALDAPMWDVILKYLPHADAKAQMEAYTSRQDLIQQHGLQYSFDNLLKQYHLFVGNYHGWSLKQFNKDCPNIISEILQEQAKMPSWMIYAFTEPGDDVAWIKLDVERGYLRVLSNEFKDFQANIEADKFCTRWCNPTALYAEAFVMLGFSACAAVDSNGKDIAWVENDRDVCEGFKRVRGRHAFQKVVEHDHRVLTMFKKKAHDEHQDLVNTLTKATMNANILTPKPPQ